MAEVYKQIYEKFYLKLVNLLPMNNVIFIAKLSAKDLLPGDIQTKLLSFVPSADKSSYFLDRVIKPALDAGYTEGFDKLLEIMENSEYFHVKATAAKITSDIAKAYGPGIGMYL